MLKLKKGSIVHLSEIGAKGFYYPTNIRKMILEDVEARTLSWIGGGDDFQACLIPKNAIDISSVTGKHFMPVWVKSKYTNRIR